MRELCIANEVVRQIPRENLLSLVSEAIDRLPVGAGYYVAWPNHFPDDTNQTASIGVLTVRTGFHEIAPEVRFEVSEKEQVIWVNATPIPPNMRVQVSCNAEWLATAKARGFDLAVWQFIPPCEVAADIMRYLLRMIEGNERAAAWRPLPILPPSELAPLLQPITLNWRISELKRWVEDYQSDTNADITFFHSPAKGYIDIYDVKPSPTIGMYCERPVNGAIELLPYILEEATPSAIAELQRWRDALEAETGKQLSQGKAEKWEPRSFIIGPILPGGDYYQLMAEVNGVTRDVVTEYYRKQGVVVTDERPARKGGRPRNPDDDWAYEQLSQGRQQSEVFAEWLTRIGTRAKTLADPQDTFKKAIRARREEKTEERE